MKELLKIKNVSLSYHTEKNETKAVENLNLSVNDGEFVSLVGPSGCGKTTILSMIAGIIPTSDGNIKIEGQKVLKPSKITGYMLQHDELFDWLSIYKNVILPLKIKKIFNKETDEYVKTLLNKYGLGEFTDYKPRELSGGMRQRAALIRTLSFSPKLLLLDEPFSALDFQTRLSVCDDVHKIIKTEEKTAILVTHDIGEAISLSDRIIVLTKRPTKVFNEHTITFEKNLTPLKRRETEEFGKYFEKIWGELNV